MGRRLDILRAEVDKLIISKQPYDSRNFFIHIYGVAGFCSLLALKRGLDTELAISCGMLHDIYQITHDTIENHAVNGASVAKEILDATGLYKSEEINIITNAITTHSKKRAVHDDPYTELLKDADVLSHCLYDPDEPVIDKEVIRFDNLLEEFGC